MERQSNQQPKPLQPFLETLYHKTILLEHCYKTLLHRHSNYLFSSFTKGQMIYIVERIKTNRFTGKQSHNSIQCKDFKEALKEFNK